MSFHTIPGQELAKRMLQKSLREGTLSHAYLFAGAAGSGKEAMALTLAQALLCTSMNDDACGECVECRKVDHGNHPNLIRIDPDGTSIKIDQIRELQRKLGYRSSGSQKKVYIISQAERMTAQASNSLLKFLEEPATDVVAVLITENGQALLPTIQSRVQLIPFVPLAPAEMIQILHHKEAYPLELVIPAAHISGGLQAARNLVISTEFAEARGVMLQLAKETWTDFPHVLVTSQQTVFKAGKAESLPLIVDLWLLLLKDMIHIRYGYEERLVYMDQRDWTGEHAIKRSMSFLVKAMENLIELKKQLRTTANAQLALDNMIIQMQKQP